MSKQNSAAQDVSTAAFCVAGDSAADAASDAKRQFISPEMLVADRQLGDREKYDLLREWSRNLDQRLPGEDERKRATDPIPGRFEAKLADERARVRTALTELALRLGDD